MSNLSKVKLQDVATIQTGKLDSNAAVENGLYPFFTCDPKTLSIDTWSYDTEAVLLAGNNASGNYTAKYYCGKFNAYQRTYIIESKFSDILNTKFLSYAINQQLCLLKSMSAGSTTKFLTMRMLNNLSLFLPSVAYQNRIASILSAYDDLIENNQKQIKLLEEAAQRLYKEWFVDLRFPGWENTKIVDGVPEGWERLPLPQIADIQYGFAFDGSLFNSSGYGTPIVRIRNIPDAETSDFTSEEASSEYLINNGDIIVGMDGEFHINSWAGGQAYLVQRTCCIRPKIEKIRGWLLYSIHEPIKYFEKTIVGATVAHLGKKHLDSITLLVPTEELYAPFISIFDKRQILMEENIKLREVRDRLIYMLMSTN